MLNGRLTDMKLLSDQQRAMKRERKFRNLREGLSNFNAGVAIGSTLVTVGGAVLGALFAG
jgi:uncharacterized pyridoxal phosphate-containing UPF0001 family protein